MTQDQINEKMQNAKDNGFSLIDMSDEDIARDLAYCDADCEDMEVEKLLPFIKTWRATQ